MSNDDYFNENDELKNPTNEIEGSQKPIETNIENVEQINLSENNNDTSKKSSENGLKDDNETESIENKSSASNSENAPLKSTLDFLKSVKLNKQQEIENKQKVDVKKKKRKHVKIFASIASGIAVIAIAATITYITLFSDKKYVLNVDYGDGNSTQIEVDKNGKVTNLEDPVLKGYNFAGWFLDSEFTIPFNPSKDTIRANTTIYAKFEVKSFAITYYSNMENVSAFTAQANFNSNYTLPENTFTKPNYNFVGWSLTSNPSATDVVYNAGATRKLTEEGASYYAIWAGVEKSINYEINDLIISNKKPQITGSNMKYGDSYVIPNLEKIYGGTSNHKDYNKYFLGFKIAGDTTNKTHKYGDTIVVNSNITFSAVWGECTNKLDLVLNNGTTTGETSFNYVTGYEIILPTATKQNYIFKGWNTSSNGTGTMYAAGEHYVITNNENAKLYAIWEGEKKVITFSFTDARINGTVPTIENAEIKYNETYTIPTLENVKHKDNTLLFAGFTILGDVSGTVYAMGSQIKITENVTFVEHFENTGNTLKFNLQSGTGSFADVSYVTGHNFNLPSEVPTKINYVFMGWNTNSNGNGTRYQANDIYVMSEGISTLYAIWEGETRTVTFEFTSQAFIGDAPATKNPVNFKYGETSFTVENNLNLHSENNDKNFLGFKIKNDASGKVYAVGEEIISTDNITLIDVWGLSTNRLFIYNPQDGSGIPTETVIKTTGYNYELPNVTSTNENYTMLGYSTVSGSQTVEYAVGSSYVFTDNTNARLFIIWEAKSKTINFDKNASAATGTVSGINSKYGNTITLPNNAYSYTNYHFVGWNTGSNGTGTNFPAGSSYTINFNETSITLYAMWAHDTIIVTYHANGGSFVNPENTTDELDSFTQTTPRNGSNVTKKYFTCKKWSLSPTDETQIWNGLTGGNNITLYAVYERNIATLTFVGGDGGTTTLPPVQHGEGLMFTLPINGNGFHKTGYDVTGFTVNGNTYETGANVLIEESITITPNWVEESYVKFVNTPTESLHFNSGKRVANQIVKSTDAGKTIIMPRALTTEIEVGGITKYFSGWATTQNASTPTYWLAEPVVVPSTKTNLYPVYLEATTTDVTFRDIGNGEVSFSNVGNNVKTLIIPSTYNGKPVTHITSASGYSILENLIIPNSVVSADYNSIGAFGMRHFYWPSGLKTNTTENMNGIGSFGTIETMVFGEGVQNLTSHVMGSGFYDLKTVVLPESLLSIGKEVFSGAENLTNIEMPSNLQSIGERAFLGLGLTEITIPASVTSLGGGFVAMCPNLTNIILESNQHFIIENGILYNKAKTQMLHVESSKLVDGFTFANTVTKLESYIFVVGNFTTYTIPNQITSIGEGAFGLIPNLTSVTMGNNVLSLGDSAFSECTSLTSVTIPNSVTSIGDYAFYNCTSLTSVTIPNSVTSIGDSAFYNCTSLTTITIPNSVTSMGISVFNDCINLTEILVSWQNQPAGWAANWQGKCPANIVKPEVNAIW